MKLNGEMTPLKTKGLIPINDTEASNQAAQNLETALGNKRSKLTNDLARKAGNATIDISPHAIKWKQT